MSFLESATKLICVAKFSTRKNKNPKPCLPCMSSKFDETETKIENYLAFSLKLKKKKKSLEEIENCFKKDVFYYPLIKNFILYIPSVPK